MSYTVIKHPATGRFVCKVDWERGIMFVVDRGQTALIDLAQVRSADDETESEDGDDTGIRVDSAMGQL